MRSFSTSSPTNSTAETGPGEPYARQCEVWLVTTRLAVTFQGKKGHVALDQLRTVDRQRLARRLGALPGEKVRAAADALVEMFTLR